MRKFRTIKIKLIFNILITILLLSYKLAYSGISTDYLTANEGILISKTTLTTQSTSPIIIMLPDVSGTLLVSGGVGSFTSFNINNITLSADELISLKGVTSAIQDQLNNKMDTNIGSENKNMSLVADNSGNITWNYINNEVQNFVVSEGKNISSGDIVQFINGKIEKGIGEISTDIIIGNMSNFNNYTSNYLSADTLSSNKFVVAYQDVSNSNCGTAVIGTIIDTNISYGNPYTFNGATGGISIASLDSSRFIISYRDEDNLNYGTAVIGNVSGTVISFGNEYTFNNSYTDEISTSVFNPQRFVIGYQDTGNSNYGTTIIGTVSETNISFGNEYTFNNTLTTAISVATTGNYTFVVGYKDNTNNGKAIIGSLKRNDIDAFFEEYQEILTNGGINWEYFVIDDVIYLAIANHFNGSTYNINSTIYKWNGSSFNVTQTLSTKAGFDIDFFSIDNESYISVANNRDGSTFNLPSKIYNWDAMSFCEIQSIDTNGARKWENFVIEDEVYLALANYKSDTTCNIDSKIYKWNGSSFTEFQSIPTSGAKDWESFIINNETYLALANGYNDITGNIDSKIYKWNGSSFTEFQSIPTSGAKDWESFTINENIYIVVANHYNGTYNVDSKIYKWNGAFFSEFQTIPTVGADDCESFIIYGDIYLAVANYRNSETCNIDSKVYKWNGSSFVEFQTIPTSGASDLESFTINENAYLAVANQSNNTSRNINSKIYQWNVKWDIIEFGDSYTFDNSPISQVTVAALNDNCFIITYIDSNNVGNAIVATISVTNISFGEQYTFNNAGTSNISISSIDSNRFILSYNNGGNNNYGVASIGLISGIQITFGNENIINNEENHSMCLLSIENSKAIFFYQDIENLNAGTAIVGEYNHLYPIGIALENGNSGDSVQVVLSGIAKGLTLLTTGKKYFANNNGTLTTTTTERYVGIALSETDLLIMKDSPGDIDYLNKAGGTINGSLTIQGDLLVNGTISKGSGSFVIDHPLDPKNKYLYHSFVESPDMMNVYNGIVVTNNQGIAEVILPEYFEALNSNFRYQLTCIGTFAQVIIYEEIVNNKFVIKSDKPHVKVSWQVTGIRKDPYAEMNRIKVEVYKKKCERGSLLHPNLYPKEKTTILCD